MIYSSLCNIQPEDHMQPIRAPGSALKYLLLFFYHIGAMRINI